MRKQSHRRAMRAEAKCATVVDGEKTRWRQLFLLSDFVCLKILTRVTVKITRTLLKKYSVSSASNFEFIYFHMNRWKKPDRILFKSQ